MSLAIHTDAPLIPLTRMIGTDGIVEIGRAPAGGADCIEGWAEPRSGAACRPHHIIWGIDDEITIWVAKTLVRLGHTVVVTMPTGADQYGDHAVVEDLPYSYIETHSH